MSFIVPVVMLNEALRNRSGGIIKGIAKHLGADEIHRPIIGRVESEPLPNEDDAGFSQA
jgi:hypothetical protein